MLKPRPEMKAYVRKHNLRVYDDTVTAFAVYQVPSPQHAIWSGWDLIRIFIVVGIMD